MTGPAQLPVRATPPDVFDAWAGLLANRRPWRVRLSLVAPIDRSKQGGSGSFLGRASDGNEYWIKPTNNLQGAKVPVTEQIVARAGGLIGAPCCKVAVIFIPKRAAGWEFRPGVTLVRGFAHASEALGNATEVYGIPGERSSDDNAVREVGYFALYDWCWGDDMQGLLALDRDRAYFSHDHGWFLPPQGPGWDIASLKASVDLPREIARGDTGLSKTEAARIADRLEHVSRADLIEVVGAIPRSWHVTDAELEAAGAFLERRAPAVAQRLRARFGVIP